jgi:MoaA/NifB/PqqE/SkfB family radical SAM enzyme
LNNRHLHVEIEPTNNCNTRCFHCPHETITRPKGLMEWETYVLVADQVRAYSDDFSIEYAGMGDPLLNPRFYDFVKYISPHGFTSATTNATALTQKNMEKVLDAGLGRLTISFNGTDPELYELMMGGLSFRRAEDHLKMALEMSKGSRTQVGANVSVTRQTQDHLVQIRQYLEDAGVTDIFFSKCHHRGGFLKGDLVCRTPPPPSDDFRCDIFTKTVFVAWTGQVLSCCHDLAGDNVIGDLRSETLAEIFDRKTVIAADGVRFDICKGCNDMYRFMDDRTLDGRPIADWVYELYTDGQDSSPRELTSLSKWMNVIYQQEEKQEQLLASLAGGIEELQAAKKELEREKAELNRELQIETEWHRNVENSRAWRMTQRLLQFRRALIPEGSRREQFFYRFLGQEQPQQ